MSLAALALQCTAECHNLYRKHETIKVNQFTAKKIQKSEMNDVNDYKLRQNNLSCVVCVKMHEKNSRFFFCRGRIPNNDFKMRQTNEKFFFQPNEKYRPEKKERNCWNVVIKHQSNHFGFN